MNTYIFVCWEDFNDGIENFEVMNIFLRYKMYYEDSLTPLTLLYIIR